MKYDNILEYIIILNGFFIGFIGLADVGAILGVIAKALTIVSLIIIIHKNIKHDNIKR